MPIDPEHRLAHLFTLRLWLEETAAGEQQWRGRICDAATGEVRYFREWGTLIPLLLAMVRNREQSQGSTHE